MPSFRPVARRYGRRRGGSWKVAYADLVTALMALFIVLWLMNTSRQVQQAVGAYFRDPKAYAKTLSGAVGAARIGAESASMTKDNAQQLKEKLEEAINALPKFQKLRKQVQMSITAEGLRIELLETEGGLFFESGRPEPRLERRADARIACRRTGPAAE